MVSVPGTAAIEAMEAHVQSSVIVLEAVNTKCFLKDRDRGKNSYDTYNGIKALGTIFSIHGLQRPWWAEI